MNLKKLIVPLVIEQFLTIAVGLIDSMMVASVGESAVSAISLVDTVNILIINIFTALATGGAVVAGQYIGMKQEHNSCKAANQNAYIYNAYCTVCNDYRVCAEKKFLYFIPFSDRLKMMLQIMQIHICS